MKKKTNNPVFDEVEQRLAGLLMDAERVGRLKLVIELQNWAAIAITETDNPDTLNVIKQLLKKLDNA